VPWQFGETQRFVFAAELSDVEEVSEFARRCAAREGAHNVMVMSTSRRRARVIARALRDDGVRALALGLPDRDVERRADDDQLRVLSYRREGSGDAAEVLVVSESEAMASMLRRVVEELAGRGQSVTYAHGEHVVPAAVAVRAARMEASRALDEAVPPESTDAGLDEMEQ